MAARLPNPEAKRRRPPAADADVQQCGGRLFIPALVLPFVTLLFSLILDATTSAWAASAGNGGTTVQAVVNSTLSITDNSGGTMTLTFSDFVSSSETNAQSVTYTVSGNNINAGAVTGIISAALNQVLNSQIDLKGDVGSFTSTATGNSGISATSITETSAGFVTVGTTSVNLVNKALETGKKIIRGTVPITWKAVATGDLPSGTYSATLTVTLIDGN